MSWSRPGGESGVRSFGDEARLALACVVDQRAASKEAAQVGVQVVRDLSRWGASWRTWWRRGCRGCVSPGSYPSDWLCHISSDIFLL